MKALLALLAVLLTLGGLTAAAIYLATTPKEELGPTERWLAEGGMDLLVYGAGALALVLFIGWSFWRRARARGVWARFASDHGFRYEGAASWFGVGDRITGSVRGRALTLEIQQLSEESRQVMAVEVRGLPDGLSVFPRLGAEDLFGGLVHRLVPGLFGHGHAPQVETGDRRFDQAAQVDVAEPEAARTWLTERRRAALLKLLETEGQHLIEGRLVHSRRGRSADARELDDVLYRLDALAEQLEASDG